MTEKPRIRVPSRAGAKCWDYIVLSKSRKLALYISERNFSSSHAAWAHAMDWWHNYRIPTLPRISGC